MVLRTPNPFLRLLLRSKQFRKYDFWKLIVQSIKWMQNCFFVRLQSCNLIQRDDWCLAQDSTRCFEVEFNTTSSSLSGSRSRLAVSALRVNNPNIISFLLRLFSIAAVLSRSKTLGTVQLCHKLEWSETVLWSIDD